MSEKDGLKEFNLNHPWPDQQGVTSLFRFSKIDNENIEFLRNILVERKLYHSLPAQFNDPFECKPHFNWPTNPHRVRDIRKHLLKGAHQRGISKKEAEATTSKSMSKPEVLQEMVSSVILQGFSKLRICCFTASKENLLFWAHYGDSHKGFCIEYDATKMPIMYALKVKYQDEYPEITYPLPTDKRGLAPALIKSRVWEYENEYRTILLPGSHQQLKNDGDSLILAGNEIKNIYFGADIEAPHRELILALIQEGPFSPGIWDASLSRSSFKLDFSKVENA